MLRLDTIARQKANLDLIEARHKVNQYRIEQHINKFSNIKKSINKIEKLILRLKENGRL